MLTLCANLVDVEPCVQFMHFCQLTSPTRYLIYVACPGFWDPEVRLGCVGGPPSWTGTPLNSPPMGTYETPVCSLTHCRGWGIACLLYPAPGGITLDLRTQPNSTYGSCTSSSSSSSRTVMSFLPTLDPVAWHRA